MPYGLRMSTNDPRPASIASTIIDKFGGTRPLARLLDMPPTTVQSWLVKGLIPSKHQIAILETAKREGVSLAPDDFFRIPEGEAAQ